MVTQGIVMHSDSGLKQYASDAELLRLSQSEHPILRAAAFREMWNRKSLNHQDLMLNHLDDTALVFTDAGEFGIWDRTVSDDILQQAFFLNEEERSRVIDTVLFRYNYLQSAYIVLKQLEPKEKYYAYIKDMALRPRRIDPREGNELGFGDIEFALYGLAKFQKKDDVKLIRERLMKHYWKMSDISFQLIQEYPDSAYFDVLHEYHRRRFYKFSGFRPHGFTGFPADRAAPEDFINALVAQRTKKSATLLDTILTNLENYTWMRDRETILDETILAIWNTPCKAYEGLINKIESRARKLLKGRVSLDVDPVVIEDSLDKRLKWFP